MHIRKAAVGDLPEIMRVFEHARQRMRLSGNHSQWINGYPSADVIIADIGNGNFYVEEESERITGCFAFIIGKEPTYEVIEGSWGDDKPYGTIHRLASAPGTRGFAQRCISFCKKLIPNLRADTHRDNVPMQHILEKEGFRYCGIIHVADGSPRLAYRLDS